MQGRPACTGTAFESPTESSGNLVSEWVQGFGVRVCTAEIGVFSVGFMGFRAVGFGGLQA